MEQLHNGVLRSCPGGWSLSGDPNILLCEKEKHRERLEFITLPIRKNGIQGNIPLPVPPCKTRAGRINQKVQGVVCVGKRRAPGSKHEAGVSLLGVSVSLLEPQWYFSYLSHVPQTKPTSYEGLQVGTSAHFLVFLPETPHEQ